MKNLFSIKCLLTRVLPAVIIGITLLLNSTGSRAAVDRVQKGEPLTLSINNNLPDGEYALEYYIACSGTSPSLTFTLAEERADGEKHLFDQRNYTVALGFAASRFTVSGDNVITASFAVPEGAADSAVWAGVGTVRVKGKDGAYVGDAIYTPAAAGRQAAPLSLDPVPEAVKDPALSDFAALKDYSLNGTVLTLNFMCTKSPGALYELGLWITSGNINALLPAGEAGRFYGLTTPTDSWQPGEVYTQTIDLKLSPERYRLEAALVPVSPGTAGNIKAFRLKENQNRLVLGIISIDG